MVFIAVVAAGLVAVLPAAAQANGPWWFVDGIKVGDAKNKQAMAAKGDWSFGDKDTGFVVGPCGYTGVEKIWNGATVGEDEVTAMTFTVPCNTSVKGCTASKITPAKLPWKSVLVMAGGFVYDETKAVEVDITFDNNAGCKGAGIGGKTIPASGSFKGRVGASSSCIGYEKAEGISSTEFGEMWISGEDCLDPEGEGKTVTAKEE